MPGAAEVSMLLLLLLQHSPRATDAMLDVATVRGVSFYSAPIVVVIVIVIAGFGSVFRPFIEVFVLFESSQKPKLDC